MSLSVSRSQRSFRLLWAGQSVSLVGDQIFLFAVPVLVIQELHATTFQVTALATLAKIPFLLFGLPAGVWVARMGLRKCMLTADVVRAACVFSIPVATLFGIVTFIHVAIVASVTGVCAVFFQVAYQSYPPLMLDTGDELHRINARLSFSEATSLLVGPAIGGWLVNAIGASRSLIGDAFSYIVSIGTLASIRQTGKSGAASSELALLGDVIVGLLFVWRHPILRPVVLCTAIYNLGSMMYESIIVLFAIRHLHLSSWSLAIILAVGGIGFPLGTISGKWLGKRLPLGGSVILGAVLAILGLFVSVLAAGKISMYLLTAGTLVNGAGQGIYIVHTMTIRHVVTPISLATRTTAVHRFVTWGIFPVGSLCAGLIGTHFGLRAAVIVAASISACCLLPLFFSSVRRVDWSACEGMQKIPA
ncbi:MFS transporter [Streptomyces sp. NPDC007355]|uniref:MFS transporter n=1 Tax=Streptomyces sp. NPDC007355 TaxID=3364778 RepID=UPI003694B132